jgi:hypothetical protein
MFSMTNAPAGTPLAMPRGYEPSVAGASLPWSHVEQRLDTAREFWLATVRRDGSPHVTPVWGVWAARAFYFTGIPTAGWARNLAANSRAAVHLESGTDVVVVNGSVEDVPAIDDSGLARLIVGRWTAKYGTLVPDPESDGMYALRVRKARAWTAFPRDATTWTFDS